MAYRISEEARWWAPGGPRRAARWTDGGPDGGHGGRGGPVEDRSEEHWVDLKAVLGGRVVV